MEQKPNFFEWVEECMELYDCDYETACREYHALFDLNYNSDDYDA